MFLLSVAPPCSFDLMAMDQARTNAHGEDKPVAKAFISGIVVAGTIEKYVHNAQMTVLVSQELWKPWRLWKL
jgi:hypothetical protein